MGGHKGVIFCIKTCFRSVCRHPFLMGMVFWMIFLYKYFPFMFSFLVWASPVFITTVVLLGTILSYGKLNIPVTDKKRKLSTGNVFSELGVRRDGNVVRKDDNFGDVWRFSKIGEASSSGKKFSDAGRDDSLSRKYAVLANEKSREFETEKQGSDVERKLPDMVLEKNDELTGLEEGKSESFGIQESHEKSLDQLQNKSPEKFDGNIATGLYWKQVEDEDEDKEISDSVSDRTVSISPATSLTDISPIDELHPLLDDDAPLPTQTSPEVSDATSVVSSNTISESSYELDTDMETHGEGMYVTDLEENIYADNDDDVKSAVSWTDDDHKNAINLGSSDLERNQRLEDLIATRSLRKSMKLMAERNLIDLDGIDRPVNVAQVSTSRPDPFNLSDDLNSNLPGSAPPIMTRRRSPFELSYDPGEEKHGLMGDDYELVVTLQPKDTPVLRRNETFSAGPSVIGTSRHDFNLRPSYFHSRKLSDLTESKASSEPETESLGSVEDLEDKIPAEENDSGEPVVTTIAEHPSEDIGHGTESSEDEGTVKLTEPEKEDASADDIKVNLEDADNSQEKRSSLSETAVADTHMEGDTSEANEAVTQDDSSSTSLSEERGNLFNEKEGEQLSHIKPTMESSDAESTSQSVDDTHQKEPVYDSSPTAHLSSSSLFSDHQVDIAETNSPPVSVERTISATDNESDVTNQITEKDTPATETDDSISARHQSPSENNASIQSDKELPLSDQSVVERSPVKHEVLQDSADASEVQERDEAPQPHGKPTTSEAASTQPDILETEATPDRPDPEDNMPSAANSDTILVSEKSGSGPAESEEVSSPNAGETISDMPVESGIVKDKEPRCKEDEHTNDGSGEPEMSPGEDNIPRVGNSDTILISEKTDSGPTESDEVASRNAGETISDMAIDSGIVKDKEPSHKEDEHTYDGSGESEISRGEDNISRVGNSDTVLINEKTGSEPAESDEAPSRNAGKEPVESGIVKDKEPSHTKDGSSEPEIFLGEDNISHVGNSDTVLISENTGSVRELEEVSNRNAGKTISDMPVDSGIFKDKEPSHNEDEHTYDGSVESEISPGEDNVPRVGNSSTISVGEKSVLEKTGSEPTDSEEVTSLNAGETIPDMPVESGTVKNREPRHEEDKHTQDGSDESEISPQSRPGVEAEVGLPVAEARSLEDVKLASKQVDLLEFQTAPHTPTETEDDFFEHYLHYRSSEPDEIGSESSKSVQDSHSKQKHDEASKREPPESNINEPKKPPRPKSWWSRFRKAYH